MLEKLILEEGRSSKAGKAGSAGNARKVEGRKVP
jgi:hypothetical protein